LRPYENDSDALELRNTLKSAEAEIEYDCLNPWLLVVVVPVLLPEPYDTELVLPPPVFPGGA